MSQKEYYHDIDLNANQLLNSRVHNISTIDRTALGLTLTPLHKGYQVYDTDLLSPYWWDGSQWVTSASSTTWGSITGTITAQTDLTSYLSTNYYPLSSNPAGYLTSVPTPTLQQVLDNNHDLVDGNNFQGTNAGALSTGTNIIGIGDNTAYNFNGNNAVILGTYASMGTYGNNVIGIGSYAVNANVSYSNPGFSVESVIGIGDSAAANQNGSHVIGIGTYAAGFNTVDNTIAIGNTAAFTNSGANVIAIGNNTLPNNYGNDIVAIGTNAGGGNFFGGYGYTNLFGTDAYSTAPYQTVLSGGYGKQARISYYNITQDRQYELPDLDGTIPLSVNGNTADIYGNITIGTGTVTGVTATSPLSSTGGTTPDISIQQASGFQAGYLSSTDWNTFNYKVGGSGIATRIAFWDTYGSLSSNSNLYWDNTNNRLGLGTITPGYTLDVFGSANIKLDNLGPGYFPSNKFAVRNGMLRIGYDTDPLYGARYIQFTDELDTFEYFSFNSDQSGNPAFSMASAASFSINAGPANYGLGAPLMTVLKTGEVGIGTTSPGYTLDITGTFHTSGQNTLSDLAGTGTRMVVADLAGVLSTQTIPSFGGVTSVTATLPLLSSGGGTPDISIPQAGFLQDGYLNGTDWFTFASKQDAIALTTIGTSGAATFGGNILNIPQYQAAGTYVTSVGATGPITSSGGTTPTISTSMATNKLIGRSTAGTGVMEEISVGTGLSLSGGTLSATATGILHGTASGTDTYTATIGTASSYTDGDAYLVRFTNGNTTSATLNINGIGAVDLYRNNDGTLIGGDIVDGAEMLCIYNSGTNRFQVIGVAPNTLIGYVTNGESITITKGQPVYAFSGTGDRMVVKLAYNTTDATSAQTVGLVMSTSIGANQKGLIMMQGLLDGLSTLPTSTYTDGDAVYLGTTAGSITKVKQYAPNHLVYLGVVTTASPGAAGRMYVRVQNGYELDELHNVQAQTPTVNDVLYYFGGSPGQWKTASISSVLGYTPANASAVNPAVNLFNYYNFI
jgi:hypothetical protein